MSGLPDKHCKDCVNEHKCSQIYEQLSKSSCKPITTTVSIAFLLPMVVFIFTAAIVDSFCEGFFSSETSGSLFSLASGVVAAGISVFVGRIFISKNRK